MRISEFMIDLNDFWGRLIPGLFIIFDLYLMTQQLLSFNIEKVLTFFSQNAILSTILFFGLLLIAHVLGELSLYPIFRLSRFLPTPTPRENMQELDVTKAKNLVKFYQEHFADRELDSTNGLLFNYCKAYLLQTCPEAYSQARRIEARINLKGGMIIPLIGLSVLFILAHLWMAFFIAFALLLVFLDGFRTSFKGEHQFVYRSYYTQHKLQEEKT